MSETNDKFDLKIVHDNFLTSLNEDDDVKLDLYLSSFDELNKFFTLMGTIFGFVSKDLRDKMLILSEFLKKEDISENFISVKKMIEYEKQNELLHKKGYISGSRTLLRIHRGLDFIRLFLKKVYDLKHEETTATACRQAYDETLAKHHSFVIRKGAHLAMYTLPTKDNLLQKVCGGTEEAEKAIEILPKTLEITSQVYDRIENLYTKYDLHSLP